MTRGQRDQQNAILDHHSDRFSDHMNPITFRERSREDRASIVILIAITTHQMSDDDGATSADAALSWKDEVDIEGGWKVGDPYVVEYSIIQLPWPGPDESFHIGCLTQHSRKRSLISRKQLNA